MQNTCGPNSNGPNIFGPNTYGQNSYRPNTYVQNTFGSNTYGPNTYWSNTYGQNTYGQNTYPQNSYRQNTYGVAPTNTHYQTGLTPGLNNSIRYVTPNIAGFSPITNNLQGVTQNCQISQNPYPNGSIYTSQIPQCIRTPAYFPCYNTSPPAERPAGGVVPPYIRFFFVLL